jgi:hypothetical protein
MSDAEDSGRVKIQLSSPDRNVLVIEYNATTAASAAPDKEKSKRFRQYHFKRLRITYEGDIKNIRMREDEAGKIMLTIKFPFAISTESDDKRSVRTYKKEDIFSIQKFFFDLNFTIKKDNSSKPCEFRLEDGYSWEVWKNSMPDDTRAPTSASPQQSKKQDKDKRQEKDKKFSNLFKRKDSTRKKGTMRRST